MREVKRHTHTWAHRCPVRSFCSCICALTPIADIMNYHIMRPALLTKGSPKQVSKMQPTPTPSFGQTRASESVRVAGAELTLSPPSLSHFLTSITHQLTHLPINPTPNRTQPKNKKDERVCHPVDRWVRWRHGSHGQSPPSRRPYLSGLSLTLSLLDAMSFLDGCDVF